MKAYILIYENHEGNLESFISTSEIYTRSVYERFKKNWENNTLFLMSQGTDHRFPKRPIAVKEIEYEDNPE